MPQRLGYVGDVRARALEHRCERVPRRVGRYAADAQPISDLRHAPIDPPRDVDRLHLTPRGVLRTVEDREQEGRALRRVPPPIDDRLHPFRNDHANLLARAGRPFGLLPHETHLPVEDVAVPQLDKIGHVDTVAEV